MLYHQLPMFQGLQEYLVKPVCHCFRLVREFFADCSSRYIIWNTGFLHLKNSDKFFRMPNQNPFRSSNQYSTSQYPIRLLSGNRSDFLYLNLQLLQKKCKYQNRKISECKWFSYSICIKHILWFIADLIDCQFFR